MSDNMDVKRLAKLIAKDSIVTTALGKMIEQIAEELNDYYQEKIVKARREERAKCATIAYSMPHYAATVVGKRFMEVDENGMIPPGSPYDKGRYDAALEIMKVDRDDSEMISDALARNA